MDPVEVIKEKLEDEKLAFRKKQIVLDLKELQDFLDLKTDILPDLGSYGITRKDVISARDRQTESSGLDGLDTSNDSEGELWGNSGQCVIETAQNVAFPQELFVYERLESEQRNEIQPPALTEEQKNAKDYLDNLLKTIAGDLTTKDDAFLRGKREAFINIRGESWFKDLPNGEKERFQANWTVIDGVVSARINSLIKEAEAGSDPDVSERLLQRAVSLDAENPIVKNSLEKHMQEKERLHNREKIAGYLKDLDSTQFQNLQKAVDAVKYLEYRGILPDELKEPLENATKRLEELKKKFGDITSAIRFKDLREKYKAIKELEAIEGQDKIYDPTFGVYEDYAQILRNASAVWEDASRESMNKIFNHLETYDESDARGKFNYLIMKMEKTDDNNTPEKTYYHQTQLDEYAREKTKLEDHANRQEEAEILVLESEVEPDPLKQHRLLHLAKSKFPELNGLEKRIASARDKAIVSLENLVNGKIQQVDEEVARRNFSEKSGVKFHISESHALLDRWPGQPQDLSHIRSVVDNKRETVFSIATRFSELMSKEDQIRSYLGDEKRLDDAHRVNTEIQSDLRFKLDFPDVLMRINSLMDLQRGADEQLKLIEDEVSKGEGLDWNQIRELCISIQKKTDKETGQYKKAVGYLHQAQAELLIQKLQSQIEQDNIPDAKTSIQEIHNKYPVYKERIQSFSSIVQSAEEASKAFAKFYGQARQDEKSPNVGKRDRAFEILRYIAGQTSTLPDGEELPPFQVTTYTYKARAAINELSSFIRKDLEKIKNARQAGNMVNINELAQRSRSLMMLQLTRDSDETKCCELAEESFINMVGKDNSSNGEFDATLLLWQDFKSRYPARGEECEQECLIQKAVYEVKKLINMNKPDDTLAIIEAQNEDFINGDYRYKLVRSEAYEQAGKVELALQSLGSSLGNRDVQARIDELRLTKQLAELDTKLSTHLENFRSGFNNLQHQKVAFAQPAKQMVTEYIAISNIFSEFRSIETEERFLLKRNEISKELDAGMQSIALNLWMVGNEEADLSAIIPTLVSLKKDHGSKPLARISEVLNELKQTRVKDALKASISQAIYSVKNFPTTGSLETVYEEADLLYWQMHQLESFSAGFDELGVAKKQFEEGFSRIKIIRTDLNAALESNKVLLQDIHWRSATEINDPDYPRLSRPIKFLSNSPNIGSLRESEQWKIKYDEWKNVLSYFAKVKADLWSLIQKEEWAKVIKQIEFSLEFQSIIGQNSDPILQETLGIDYQFTKVIREDYQNYLNWFSKNVHVTYNKEQYTGWDEIRILAQNCSTNLTKWTEWSTTYLARCGKILELDFLSKTVSEPLPWNVSENNLMNSGLPDYICELVNHCSAGYQNWINSNIQIIKDKDGKEFNTIISKNQKLPLSYRLWILNEYSRMIKASNVYYESGPGSQGLDKYTSMTSASEIIKSDMKENFKSMEDLDKSVNVQIKDLEKKITNKGGFMNSEETKTINLDLTTKKRRLAECKDIGPCSKEEWERYYKIALTISNDLGSKNITWWDRMKEFLRL